MAPLDPNAPEDGIGEGQPMIQDRDEPTNVYITALNDAGVDPDAR